MHVLIVEEMNSCDRSFYSLWQIFRRTAYTFRRRRQPILLLALRCFVWVDLGEPVPQAPWDLSLWGLMASWQNEAASPASANKELQTLKRVFNLAILR